MKVVINGAAGWLGQSSAHVLFRTGLVEKANDIYAFGQKSRRAKLGPWVSHEIRQLSDSLEQEAKSELFIQLAFKTRDYEEKLGDKEYTRINRSILQNSIELLKRSQARSVVIVSSGVVKRYLDSQGKVDNSPYARLKLEEEHIYAETCLAMGSRLVVLRLWGSTGEDMTEPTKYGIGDLIKQAIQNRRITIESNRLVYRRYMDSRDQMEIAIRASLEAGELVMDSGGEIIEIGQLAVRVRDIYAPGKEIVRPKMTGEAPDVYFSTSVTAEQLAHKFGISLKSLDRQIIDTGKAVARSLNL